MVSLASPSRLRRLGRNKSAMVASDMSDSRSWSARKGR